MTKHLMRQLCEALAFIHSKNVAHRDLKPEVRSVVLTVPGLCELLPLEYITDE
jgi:hypothetical protein